VIASIPPLKYFPVSRNPFEFKAGLRKLPNQCNTTNATDCVFQFDSQWPDYRASKLDARRERIDKYICQQDLNASLRALICGYLLKQLAKEHPQFFQLTHDKTQARLTCSLSEEKLLFNQQLELIGVENPQATPNYLDGLDALCCQLQEDLSISEAGQQSDHIRYLHLCFPNYWSAQEKLGKSFLSAHTPVPAMEKISNNARNLVETFVRHGPFERFTWGLATDDRLNHHPVAPINCDPRLWTGRQFNVTQPKLYMRIERQITLPFPEVHAFVFLIRSYHQNVAHFSKDELSRLSFSLSTMPEQVLKYKGLLKSKNEILKWLDQLLAAC